MPRPHLSEEDERAEAEARDRLRAAETKLRELRGRRQLLLDQIHQVSDEQKALYDQRAPRQEALDRTHEEHRDLGHRLSELRRERDRARAALDEALAQVRLGRQGFPRDDHPRPDQIRREIAQLERRQQTTALPLSEENALIDRLRLLTKQAAEADKEAGAVEQHHKKLHDLETALGLRRADLDAVGKEMDRVRVERDRRMESMRAQLIEVGHLVAQIREKGKARADVMGRIDTMSRQLFELEREVHQTIQASRDRRQEARRTIVDYNRTVRQSVAGEDAYARNAEEQLEQLLKRGRITLSG
ncbi:MAG: hypothetical protein ACREDK_01480 [Thermoplasmata archaeon]